MPRPLDLVYAAGLLLTAPIWATAMLRSGKWRTDWAGRLGRGAPWPPTPTTPTMTTTPAGPGETARRAPRVLVHAVSVGEVNAVRHLVRELTQRAVEVAVCSTTNTGFDRATQVFAPRQPVLRYPLDFSFAVERFLDRVQPDLVALTELEVWPAFTRACQRRGVPVCVVNGRLSERSFRSYRRLRPLLGSMFHRLSWVGAQNEAYAERFRAMGVLPERVTVTDSMKWDTAQPADRREVPGRSELAAAMGIDLDRPILTAGSTGPGEEDLLIRTCPREAQLILVPRKPERFEEVAALADRLARDDPSLNPAGAVVRRSQRPDAAAQATVNPGQRLFLLDTMGELRKAYALADVAIVGRSFLGLHGSDVYEPAALGLPVVIGPHHGDFLDAVDALRESNAILVSERPGEAAADLLADLQRRHGMAERARGVILARQGASRRTAQRLLELLPRS
jgi:3-deoxy-D-manno-octulosonic-acid transferase